MNIKLEIDNYDVLVVGAGLVGSVCARILSEEQKKRVLVIDRRKHIAGNMFDFIDRNTGIRVQKYGPHAFHTKDKRLYDFITRFGKWKEYTLKCMVYMNGKFTPSPFNFKTIDDYFDKDKALVIKQHLLREFPGRDQATIVELLNCKDEIIKHYADFLFEHDYSLYTAKQWGISPKEIDISVLKRVPVLFSYEEGYFNDPYQIMPLNGFTSVFEEMLNYNNIDILLGMDFNKFMQIDPKNRAIYINGKIMKKPIIYTGSLDELLDFKYGKLPYRSLQFKWEEISCDSAQDAAIVAYPQEKGFTRITEYSKLPIQKTKGKSVLAKEFPLQSTNDLDCEPYYPIITESNIELYQKYLQQMQRIPNLHPCGRLADYKYYNMDQALNRALEFVKELKNLYF